MGATASKKSTSGSEAKRSDATATESGSGQDKPSDQRGQSDSTAVASSSENVNPKQAVKTSTTGEVTTGDAVTTAPEGGRQEGEAKQSHDVEKSILPVKWLRYREIFVQYIPGKPHALTEFGALLYSNNGRHEFRGLDGTGLARAVGLRDGDVLLSINNLQAGVTNAHPLAVLECLSDVGTNIGLVIERNRKEIWLFAFHLDEEGNRPIVKGLFQHQFDYDIKTVSFPLKSGVIIPPDISFSVTPVYSYERSKEVEIILKDGDRFMEIDTDKATYITSKHILTMSFYKRIFSEGGFSADEGIPIAISTSTTLESYDTDAGNEIDSHMCDDPEPMCIEAIGDFPLAIRIFPSWMTEPNTQIPQNNMFFLIKIDPAEGAIIKAANTQKDLYITHMPDISDPDVWIANLGIQEAEFWIRENGRNVTSTKDLLRLFTVKDS